MNILELIDNVLDDLNELRSLIIDEQTSTVIDALIPPGSYVYVHYAVQEDGQLLPVYYGSGTGDRAWSDRGYDFPYVVRIMVDGLSRTEAYQVENYMLQRFMKEHGGQLPQENTEEQNLNHIAVDTLPGPYKLLWKKGDTVVEETRWMKPKTGKVGTIVGTLTSALSNKNGKWHRKLNRDQYDHVTLRFGEDR